MKIFRFRKSLQLNIQPLLTARSTTLITDPKLGYVLKVNLCFLESLNVYLHCASGIL